MESDRKAIWGWALYDWANSAFATTVMAGFFPIFFKQFWSAGADVNVSTAQLGFGNSIASLMVALMAPILGAIADKGSAKKKEGISGFFRLSGCSDDGGPVPGSRRAVGLGHIYLCDGHHRVFRCQCLL
jgi:MFS-type transporter involved in bile tolerance (Atg22 family)